VEGFLFSLQAEGRARRTHVITISFVNALPELDGYSPPNLGRMPYHS
jgi:hypothetical protein